MNFIKIKNCSASENEIKIGILVFLCIEKRILTVNSNLRNILRKKKKEKFFEQLLEKVKHKTIHEIIAEYSLTVNFWWPSLSRKNGPAPKIVTTFSSDSMNPKIVNFMIESKRFKKEDIEKYNLQLVVGDSPLNINRNFWDCASELLGLEKDQMLQRWGSDEISFHQERKFVSVFGKGFTIWRVESFADRDRNNARQRLIFKSSSKNCFVLQSQKANWDVEKCLITANDCFSIPPASLFEYYRCPNCHFNDKDITNFKRHIKNCRIDQIHKFKWSNLCESFEPQKYLLENKFIDQLYDHSFFVSYDIETLMDGVQAEVSSATQIQSNFRIASIAVKKNFGCERTAVFVRDDFSESSYVKTISDFLNFLVKARDEYRSLIPKRHTDSFFEIKDLLKQKNDLKLSVERQNNLSKSLSWLNKLRELKCLGFNSERFDAPCLMPGILKALFSKYFKEICPNEKPSLSNVSCIRRGNGYMCIKFIGLSFGDIANHFPGSLDRFGQTFKTPAQKGVFPYEFFKNISELNSQKWPLYSAFKSSLKIGTPKYNIEIQLGKAYQSLHQKLDYDLDEFFIKFDVIDYLSDCEIKDGRLSCTVKPGSQRYFHLDPVKYAESLILFESNKLERPDYSMKNWLEFYNLQDVEVTSQGFEKMINLFREKFSLNLLEYLSMPSAASRSLWKNTDTSYGTAYTLSHNFGWLADLFRQALKGGLAVPFARHVVCGENAPKWPKEVRF